MNTDSFFFTLDKRLTNGLSMSPFGSKPQWERFIAVIEAHRLQQYCPNVSFRHILETVRMHFINPVRAKKYILHDDIDFYNMLVVVVGDRKMPVPSTKEINTEKHKRLRARLAEDSASLEAMINGDTFPTQVTRRLIKIANDECKQRITDAAVERKEQEHQRREQERQQEIADKMNMFKARAAVEKPAVAAKRLNQKMTATKSGPTYIRQDEPLPQGEYFMVHKVRLAPNSRQRDYLTRCFGVARFCFNWCYDRWQEARLRGEKYFASELAAMFNAVAQNKYPFTNQVTHFAKQTGFQAFEHAQQDFFDGKGFPQRKRRRLCGTLKYTTTETRKFVVDANPDIPNSKPSRKRAYLLIPTYGYIKMMEKPRFDGNITSVTIKMESDGHYYACLCISVSQDEWLRCNKTARHILQEETKTPLGIDLGVATLATLSNGIKIDRRENTLYNKKKHLQQAIKSAVDAHPGHTSKRQKRLAADLGKVKTRIRHQREDYLHKVTSAIAYLYKNVSVENLNIHSMIRDGYATAGNIKDAAFYEFRTLLEQKMHMADHHLHVADKFLPSTRTCSVCGCIGDKMPLKERTFHCKECGATIDRDINAAVNLAKLIGLGESNFHSADKGILTAILQNSDISTHQAEEEKQAGLQT